MAEKKLTRSTDDKIIAGVASGVANYFDLDPVIVRIAFVVLALLGGPGLLLYIIMWIVMPEAGAAQVKAPAAAPTEDREKMPTE